MANNQRGLSDAVKLYLGARLVLKNRQRNFLSRKLEGKSVPEESLPKQEEG